MHRAPSILLGPAVPSFRALSGSLGGLKLTVRRQKFNETPLSPMSMADVLVDEAFEANVLLTVAWGGGS